MTQLWPTGTNCEPLKSCTTKPSPDRRVHVVLELAGFTWSKVESKLGTGFRPTLVPIVWMRQRLVCEASASRNTFEAKIRCGIALSEAQIASRWLTVGVPKGFGGGKVDSGCIHDGNREGLSRNYKLREQHVGFYLSALVTLAQENGYWTP